LDATHNFLTPDHLYEIETELAGNLPHAPPDLALDDDEMPIGLMLLNGDLAGVRGVWPAGSMVKADLIH
jgi:hypothetical protein